MRAVIVIKPGPARRVNPGPGRPGTWTGSGLLKDRLVQQPGKTRTTRTNPDETRFFPLFKCGFCPSASLLISSSSLQSVVVNSSREEKRVRDVVVGGWSGWSPVSVGGGSGLAKRRRRLGKKKEGLSSFGQPGGWLREGWRKSWLSSLLLLDGTPFRTRVKKEGKRMSFIF